MFTFIRNRRRQRLLAEPFPPHWDAILRKNVRHYSLLSDGERAKLRDIVRILVAEKLWEPAHGFHVTEEMKLTIAAQAGLLLIGLPNHDYFRAVTSIVVHPGEFRHPDPDDHLAEDDLAEDVIGGLANYRGPVVLGWEQSLAESREPEHGYNLVIHEFAHQLDFLDQVINGTPPLETREQEARWVEVMTPAFEKHRAELKRGKPDTFFTEHAGDDEAEFFADATEAFYCTPADLKAENPDMYEILASFYRVDPIVWLPYAGRD